MKLFWHCFKMGSDDKKFVTQCLCELSQFLEKPPAEIQLEAMPLPPELKHQATQILNAPPQICEAPFSVSYYIPFRTLLKNYNSTRVLIYCKPNSNIAKAARDECHRAAWGLCSEPPLITAVYELNNEYLLWHEALHLFDACDCYCYANPEDHTGSNCELSNCIMQYRPTEKTVGEWPFLCQKNIKRIQAWSKKHKLNDSDGRD